MQMKPYPKYKDSGIEWIGEIPDGWEVHKLKFNSDVLISNVDKKSKENESEVSLCNYVDVFKNEFITKEIEFMKATATPGQISKLKLKKHDVIITKDSETPEEIAEPALMAEDIDNLVCAYHLAIIKPGNNYHGSYIMRLFKTKNISEQFCVEANGVTRFGIGTYPIKNIIMYFPPKPEQKAIVFFLDKKTSEIDDLISKNKKLIELEKEKRVALINHAVTKGLDTNVKLKDSGVEWIGEIPEDWGIRKFSHISKRISVGFVGSIEKHYTDETGIPLLKTGNIGNGEVLLNKLSYVTKEFHYANVKSQLIPGDIIIARHGESGKSAVIAKMLKHANCLNIVLLKVGSKMYGKYYSYLMNAHIFLEHLQAIQGGSVQGVINTEDISQMKVIFLPKPEQEAIVEYLDKHTANIDKTIKKINKNIELLEEYKQSLIHHVVTGKVDVREIAA